jgi:hypothetical protein
MLAPLGATVAVVLSVVVLSAVSSDVLVSLALMLAPLGATVAVVLSVVVVALVSTAGLPVIVPFCGKQADYPAAVVVTFVSLAAGPNDAPPGAGVAAVSLPPPPPPVACTGLIGAAATNVSISKTVGKAIVVMNLR